MMAQSRAESTMDTYNYGQYINQFPPNTIKVIQEFERIQKKICRHKMSIMFNEICICVSVYIILKKEQKEGEGRSLTFFVIIYEERKNIVKKKERNKRKKERKKEWKGRSQTFFVIIL